MHRLLAGRSGSWEADLVGQLVYGTVGWDDEYLFEHRTEPVVIHLNIARLVEEHEYLTGRDLQTPYEREWMAIEDRYTEFDEDEDHADAEAAELSALTSTWRARYAAYAQALTDAVLAEAARIPGLRVLVSVEVDSDPDAPTNQGMPHPDYDDFTQPDPDQLVTRLLSAALRAAPVPDWTPERDADASGSTQGEP